MADVAIKVTPEQLDALAQRVTAGAGSIAAEVAALHRALDPLRSDWAGAAHARFAGLWQEWQDGARAVHDALTGLSALLAQAGHSYAEAEQRIAASFRAL